MSLLSVSEASQSNRSALVERPSDGLTVWLSHGLKVTVKAVSLDQPRPFCYDRRYTYYDSCRERVPVDPVGGDYDSYEQLPHRSLFRTARCRDYNYDAPFRRSHGKRGRKPKHKDKRG